MSSQDRHEGAGQEYNRRRFLTSAGAVAGLPAGLSAAGRVRAGGSSETNDIGTFDTDPKPLAIRADSGATHGTGGYELHNSGHLIYHGSDLLSIGTSDRWFHKFTIEGIGYTVHHTGQFGPGDYYFGNNLGNVTQAIGQYVHLEVEDEDVVGLSTDHAAQSGGWYDPESVWSTLVTLVAETEGYTISDFAEELYSDPDIELVDTFFDEEYDALEGEVKSWVQEELDVPEDDEDDHVLEALMTAAGFGTTFVPGPAGTALSVGMSLADAAGTAYENASDKASDFDDVKEDQIEVTSFDGAAKFPANPEYLTIDDEGPNVFDGYGTPMRGHHLAFYFTTPTREFPTSWRVEVEQSFAVAADLDGYANSLNWEFFITTGGDDDSERSQVENNMVNRMGNIDVEFKNDYTDGDLDSELLTP